MVLKQLLRRVFAVLLCAILTVGIAPHSEAAGFSDVPKTASYYPAVAWAVARGITSGVRPDAFCPDTVCTRAQVMTFLWRVKGCPTPKAKTSPFSDVPDGKWFTKPVLWAVENGITYGTSATTFSPDQIITLAEAVTFIWRAEKKPSAALCAGFVDVPTTAYYYNAVQWAVEVGITTGNGNARFAPNTACTRAQTVTYLYRAYDARQRAAALKNSINSLISGKSGVWSIYLYQPNSNIRININSRTMFAASLIKLYIAGAAEEAMERGKIPRSCETYLDQMIYASSNGATDYLIDKVTVDGINQFIMEQGFFGSRLAHKMSDSAPGVNYTTAEECCRVLQEVDEGTYVSQAASQRILHNLLNQMRRSKIPAGIPSGIKVGNKTGETHNTQHDAAVVYAPAGTYYLCIMCGGHDESDGTVTIRTIVQLSKLIYNSIGPLAS